MAACCEGLMAVAGGGGGYLGLTTELRALKNNKKEAAGSWGPGGLL